MADPGMADRRVLFAARGVDMKIVKKIVNAIIKTALKKKGIDTDE